MGSRFSHSGNEKVNTLKFIDSLIISGICGELPYSELSSHKRSSKSIVKGLYTNPTIWNCTKVSMYEKTFSVP